MAIFVTEHPVPTLGFKVRNMKMDLNIYGTWHRVTFENENLRFFLFGYVI